MELLDTILRTSEAGKYVENFVEHDIDISTLELLNDEDLKIIGIAESNVRENIIKKAKQLQIPSEKNINIKVDETYTLQLLCLINSQLHINNINILYGLVRGDIIICDIPLYNAAKCLEEQVTNLDITLKNFEKKVTPKRKTKKKNRKMLLILSSASLMLICAKLFFSNNKFLK